MGRINILPTLEESKNSFSETDSMMETKAIESDAEWKTDELDQVAIHDNKVAGTYHNKR